MKGKVKPSYGINRDMFDRVNERDKLSRDFLYLSLNNELLLYIYNHPYTSTEIQNPMVPASSTRVKTLREFPPPVRLRIKTLLKRRLIMLYR